MIFPSWSRLLTWHICLLLGVILKIVKEILTFNPLKNHDSGLFFSSFRNFYRHFATICDFYGEHIENDDVETYKGIQNGTVKSTDPQPSIYTHSKDK